jgi:hypothetical protein
MCGELKLLPQICLPACDARDVALVHIKSLSQDDVVGTRNLLVSMNEPQTFRQYAIWLKEEFASKGYCISTMQAPNFLIKLASYFDKSIAFVVPVLGKIPKFDNSRYVNVFKIKPIEPKRSLIDMTYSMIERGFIPKKY